MDSSSNAADGGDSSRPGGDGANRNNRNRDRSRSRTRNRSQSGERSQRSSGGRGSGGGGGGRRRNEDDTYRPRMDADGGDKSSSAPKKKGLFGKIVSFFKGDEPENKGTGRPIRTERKRPGDASAPAGESTSPRGDERQRAERPPRPPREGDGDRPKRKRSRTRNRSEDDRGGDRERSGGGGGGRGRREDGDRRAGGGGGGRGREREQRGPSHEEREGDDRQPRTKRAPRIVEVSSGRLYVGNLSYEVTDEELEDLFKGFGNVTKAEIVTNQRNQQSKGFAFVEMSHIDEARRAVEILHDKDFMGRKIVVTGAESEGPVDPSAAQDSDGDAEQTSADETPQAPETAEQAADVAETVADDESKNPEAEAV